MATKFTTAKKYIANFPPSLEILCLVFFPKRFHGWKKVILSQKICGNSVGKCGPNKLPQWNGIKENEIKNLACCFTALACPNLVFLV